MLRSSCLSDRVPRNFAYIIEEEEEEEDLLAGTYLIRKIPPRYEAYSINVTSGFIQSRMYHRFLFSEKLNLYFKPRYISPYWIDLSTVDLPVLISPKAVLNLNHRFKKNRYVSFGRPSISQNQLITPVHAPLPLQPLIFRNGRCTGR